VGQQSQPVLEVEHLTVRFGTEEVLHDLSFTAQRGSMLAIIGPNGAGKTVLLKTLVGALPYTGTMRWAPNTVLGYVPQKLDLQRDLPVSGRDFMRAKAALSHTSMSAMRSALQSVGLEEAVLARSIGSLSGGQFQRLLIAFALLGAPNLLLLDEPAAGVDEPGQAQLEQVLRQLQHDKEITVLVVSHELSLIYRCADQVLCLGRHRACTGPPRTVLTPDVLADIYGVPLSFHVHDD